MVSITEKRYILFIPQKQRFDLSQHILALRMAIQIFDLLGMVFWLQVGASDIFSAPLSCISISGSAFSFRYDAVSSMTMALTFRLKQHMEFSFWWTCGSGMDGLLHWIEASVCC